MVDKDPNTYGHGNCRKFYADLRGFIPINVTFPAGYTNQHVQIQAVWFSMSLLLLV